MEEYNFMFLKQAKAKIKVIANLYKWNNEPEMTCRSAIEFYNNKTLLNFWVAPCFPRFGVE